ncbi:MAG: hypothetical protein Q9182_006499 [Xanthomendoza sp. 2 TL-2023]
MSRSSRLLLRQMSNLKHAIALLLEQPQLLVGEGIAGRNIQAAIAAADGENDGDEDSWWLLHIDQDEILYDGNGDTSWRSQPNIGHVTFTNHEAIPVDHDTQDSFQDCVWFTVNREEVLFMAYGNGKPAVRLCRGVETDGVHRFKGYIGAAMTLPLPQTASSEQPSRRTQHEQQEWPVLLHYPYPSFEAWAAKFTLYGAFSDYWLDDERYPNMLKFMLQSRDQVQAALGRGDWSAAKAFFTARVLSEDEIARGVCAGEIRRYGPITLRGAEEIEVGK